MTARRPGRAGAATTRRAGLRFAVYAAGGTAAGITGFGTLWRGVAGGHPGAILAGLALVAAGLLFAGISLAAGMVASRQHRLRHPGGPAAPSGR